VEAKFLRVEVESFAVVADDNGKVGDGLGHDSGLWHFHDVECVEEKISHGGHRGRAQRKSTEGTES
jgi:hypothetical protein